MTWLASTFIALGALLLMTAAIGLFRLPDAMARQHAATKSGTLALGLILIGVAVHAGEPGWWGRIAVILVMLLVTLPVASHMLARAAARHAYSEETLRQVPHVDPSTKR